MVKQEYIKNYGSDEKSMKDFNDFLDYSFKHPYKHDLKKDTENLIKTLENLNNK